MYDFYVPVTINSEGRFDFDGTITVEAKEGGQFSNGQATWTEQTGNFGVFAFDGEVFFDSGSGGAMARAARRLLENNPEYANLVSKRENAKKGISPSTLSGGDKANVDDEVAF